MQYSMINEESPRPIQESLHLTYHGKAIDEDRFDAEFYARSLLGFRDSFKSLNRRVLGIDVNLYIRAEKKGSFEAIVEFLTQDSIVASAVLTGLLQFFGIDFKSICKLPLLTYKLLIDAIKKARGEKKIVVDELKKLELPEEVISALIYLIFSNKFRASLDELTFFLVAIGMESVDVEHKDNTTFSIIKKERPYFVAQPEDEISTETDEKIVSITYLSPEKDRWQFKSGKSEFWADVLDTDFLHKMSDKSLDEIIELKFATILEKTTIKEANTKKTKVDRKIYNFRPYNPPQQLELM